MESDLHFIAGNYRKMKHRNIEMDSVSFNTLIAYLFKSNYNRSALTLLRRMSEADVNPNKVTCLLVFL